MKTATVADLRNNFASISRWVHVGESIVITKRGIPFATVSPVKRRKKPSKGVDRMARLKKLFPSGHAKGDIRDVIDLERGDT
jgi:prevent-host-death family protein